VNRGDVYEIDAPGPGRRPVVILTRDVAIPVLANVTTATVTTRIRGVPTEVLLAEEQGLAEESVVNCDNLFTVPKRTLGRRLGALGPEELRGLDGALRIALALD
jgi:mRNA interferase MazF